jgi:ubiquinol-cytochrome c reductase cytochrome c subunit
MLTLPGGVRRGALGLAGAALVSLVALTGCGTSQTGDFDRGKQLFAAQCATCHSLKDSGSTTDIGPDLDAAFAQARSDGMDPDTIAGVVKAQVENPRPSNVNPSVSMPADLVTGEDLDDVATYVSKVAGNPAIKGPQLPDDPGAQVFAQNQCSGCHTLNAAGASGITGPDLDKVIPDMTAAEVKKSIVDPNAKIAPGFPPDVMPGNYEQTINPQSLNDLVAFLLKYAGQPTGGKK